MVSQITKPNEYVTPPAGMSSIAIFFNCWLLQSAGFQCGFFTPAFHA